MAADGVSWTPATAPGISELDAALDALEMQVEAVRQAACRRPEDGRSLVAEELAEMELLVLAKRLRGLLAELLREDNRAALAQAVEALCARFSRLGTVIRAVPLSPERASDTRWVDLERACGVIEAVLRDMDTHRGRDSVENQELHDKRVVQELHTVDAEDLAMNHFISICGGSLTISDDSAMTCSSGDTRTDDIQSSSVKQQNRKSLGWEVSEDVAVIAASGLEKSDLGCSTASTAASSITLPELEVTMRLTRGLQVAATGFNVSSCGTEDEQQLEGSIRLPLADAQKHQQQQKATQWFNLSTAIESDGEDLLGREEDQSWLSPCMTAEQSGTQDQPLLISLVGADACCSSTCADSSLPEVSFGAVSPCSKHGLKWQQQQQQQQQEEQQEEQQGMEQKQQQELPQYHQTGEEARPGVTAKGVCDQHPCAATAGSKPKEGMPADDGAQPLITRFSLARARHEVSVNYMRRVAEKLENLEEENQLLKTTAERQRTDNLGLLQELLRLREEADQLRLLQCTSPQNFGGRRLVNAPCLDAWHQPLEPGINIRNVPSPPPASWHSAPWPSRGDGAGVGSLMAEIWLDVAADNSSGDEYLKRCSGELSSPSSRAACGADVDLVRTRHSVDSEARPHRGIRLHREQEVAPQQHRQQLHRAGSGKFATASSTKAATRKPVAPGGVLGRLAALQRARDSEAQRERAVLRIQRAVRGLLTSP